MKSKHLFLVIIVLMQFLACSRTSNEFSITGQIKGVQDGDSVILFTVEGRVGRRVACDTIRDGRFSFKGAADSLQEIRLVAMGEKYPLTNLQVWISPGSKTRVKGNGYYPALWRVKSNVKEQQEQEIYREATRTVSVVSDSLFRVYYQEGDKIAKAASDEERIKQRTLVRAMREQLDSISFIEHRIIFDVMGDRPITALWIDRLADFSGYAAAYASLTTYPEENTRKLQELYNRLDEEQKQTRKGELIHSYIFPVEKIGVGDSMAEGRFFDPEDREHQIADYKGKYILIDFWGVGCKPCIAAFPEMKKVHESHGDKLTIIEISIDRHDIWMEGLETHQLPWLNLNDFLELGGYASFYGVHGIPFYVLVNPDGIIEKIWMGYVTGMFEEITKTI